MLERQYQSESVGLLSNRHHPEKAQNYLGQADEKQRRLELEQQFGQQGQVDGKSEEKNQINAQKKKRMNQHKKRQRNKKKLELKEISLLERSLPDQITVENEEEAKALLKPEDVLLME